MEKRKKKITSALNEASFRKNVDRLVKYYSMYLARASPPWRAAQVVLAFFFFLLAASLLNPSPVRRETGAVDRRSFL